MKRLIVLNSRTDLLPQAEKAYYKSEGEYLMKSSGIKYVVLFDVAAVLTVFLCWYYTAYSWYEHKLVWYALLWPTVSADVLSFGCLAAFLIRIFTKRFSVRSIAAAATAILTLLAGIPGVLLLLCCREIGEYMTSIFLLVWIACPMLITTLILFISRQFGKKKTVSHYAVPKENALGYHLTESR